MSDWEEHDDDAVGVIDLEQEGGADHEEDGVPRSWLARLPTKHTVVRTANGSAVDVAWRGLRLQRAEIEMWPDVVLEQARCQSR